MAVTFKLIGSTIVSSNNTTTTITFSSIPTTYDDLKLIISARGSQNNSYDGLNIYFNQQYSGSLYSATRMYGNSTTVVSSRDTNSAPFTFSINGNTATASIFGNTEIYIPNYKGSINKPFGGYGVAEDNSTYPPGISLFAGQWYSTNTISTIEIGTTGGPYFMQNSSFYLYGIKKT